MYTQFSNHKKYPWVATAYPGKISLITVIATAAITCAFPVQEVQAAETEPLHIERVITKDQPEQTFTVKSVKQKSGYEVSLYLHTGSQKEHDALTPDYAAVFYAPNLKETLQNDQSATVSAVLAPINLTGLPSLDAKVSQLQNTISTLEEDFLSEMDTFMTENSSKKATANLQGLDLFHESINQLEHIGELTPFKESIKPAILSVGGMKIDYSSELQKYLLAALEKNFSDKLKVIETSAKRIAFSETDTQMELKQILSEFQSQLTNILEEAEEDIADVATELSETLIQLPVVQELTVEAKALVKEQDVMPKEVKMYGSVMKAEILNPEFLPPFSHQTSVQFEKSEEDDEEENVEEEDQEDKDDKEENVEEEDQDDKEDGEENTEDEDEDAEKDKDEDANEEDQEQEPPKTPKVDTIYETSLSVTGTAAAGATVHAIANGKPLPSIKVEKDGTFHMPLEAPLQAGTKVKIYQENDNGQSNPVSLIVQPSEEQDKPNLNSEETEADDSKKEGKPSEDEKPANDDEIEVKTDDEQDKDADKKDKPGGAVGAGTNSSAEEETTPIEDEQPHSNPGNTLPQTATNLWKTGAAGIVTLIVGIAARFIQRMKSWY